MRVFTGVVAACCATLMFAGSGQAAPGKGPKELPPAGFAGNQYVDSEGCVFLRAGLGGKTTWVPRVGRDRNPVCGYEPTFPPGMLDAATAVAGGAQEGSATEPAATPAAAPSPEPATAPSPEPAAANPAAKIITGKRLARQSAPATIALVRQKQVEKAATYCADRIDSAQRYLLSDGRRVTQCAETAAASGVDYLNALGIPGLEVSARAPTAREIRRAEKADQGPYVVTHAIGRLTAEGKAAMTAPGPRSEPAAGGRAGPLIQIGAFAEPANADRAKAVLRGLGLPVATASAGRLKVILAGPFASATDMSNALTLVRARGYRDAFLTRG